jgi:5'(3')-deoxyribonucleotidase
MFSCRLEPMPKVIVDIDNTLWDLTAELYTRIRKNSPRMVPPEKWYNWDLLTRYCPKQEFYRILKDIQREQDLFSPYPDAALFLSSLKEAGFHIVIASHRERETFDATAIWLNKNNLLFDELHLSRDKTVLFADCWAVVDDSPKALAKAASAGILHAGLREAWNEGGGYPLFHNLMEIYRYLKDQCDPALSLSRLVLP